MVSSRGNQLLLLLGLGSWIQGFRCFPWLGVNFFLKDDLNVDSSTLQLLQSSANIPMVGKPLYGIISDAIYIRGQHRVPYIAIGVAIQAVSWMSIALLRKISMFYVVLFLLLSNLGASIVEVANDALVAEGGKRTNSSSSAGHLQSFVWMLASLGGVLGNLTGGIVVTRLSPQTLFLTFFFILVIQFLVTISVKEQSLRLPKKSSQICIRQQFLTLKIALQTPSICYSIAWFSASFAAIPVLTGTMFFYQTQFLKMNSSIVGLSKVTGQAAQLLWSMAYNRWLKGIPPRKLILIVHLMMATLMVSDMLFVKGFYRDFFGIADSLYVVVVSGLLEVVFLFKILPFSVLMTNLCPKGCEGSLMAFCASSVSLAFIISGYLGVALASFFGVSGNDFSGLSRCISIQIVCTVIPIYWSSWISNGDKKPERKKN